MKRFSKDIVGAIDYASYFALHGWLMDERTGAFPADLALTDAEGAGSGIADSFLYARRDVEAALGISGGPPLGFSMNLFDHFNRRPQDYGIFRGKSLLWSFSSSFEVRFDGVPEGKPPSEWGARIVLIVCDEGDALDLGVRRLVDWQHNFFRKSFNSAISYRLISFEDLESQISRIETEERDFILVTRAQNLTRAISANPARITGRQILLLHDRFWPEQLSSGLVNAAAALMGIAPKSPLNEVFLLELFSAISGYPDLFFPPEKKLFTLKGGRASADMAEIMRREIQGQFTDDLIVMSERPITCLDDIEHAGCALFVNLAALRHVLDIMSEDIVPFLHRATARGLKARYRTLAPL